jgi:hypothetical protein
LASSKTNTVEKKKVAPDQQHDSAPTRYYYACPNQQPGQDSECYGLGFTDLLDLYEHVKAEHPEYIEGTKLRLRLQGYDEVPDTTT